MHSIENVTLANHEFIVLPNDAEDEGKIIRLFAKDREGQVYRTIDIPLPAGQPIEALTQQLHKSNDTLRAELEERKDQAIEDEAQRMIDPGSGDNSK